MVDVFTWRQKLGLLIDFPAEKRRVADILAVDDYTLVRWAKRESTPRERSLRRLPDAFPEPDRTELISLIKKEFPSLFPNIVPPTSKKPDSQSRAVTPQNIDMTAPTKEIPSMYYASILGNRRNHHFSPISPFDLPMLQIAAHLDPAKRGIEIHLFALSPSGKTFYELLRAKYHDLKSYQHWFMGKESLAGQAILQGKGILLDTSKKQIVALIECGQRTAGCLLISCTHADQVGFVRAELVLQYADLFAVAGFREADFLERKDIDLTTIKLSQQQQTALIQNALPALSLREKTSEAIRELETFILLRNSPLQ